VWWFVVFVVAAAWWLTDSSAQFLALGALASLVVTVPAVRSQYSVFSAWTIVLLVTYVGCGIRGGFIALGIDDDQDSLQYLFLLGHGPDFFLRPSLIYIASISILTVGYMLANRHSESPSRQHASTVIERFHFRSAVVPLAALLAAIGFAAFVIYVQQTGGFSIAELSRKRTSIAGGIDANYQSYGVLRVINSLSAVALWVVVAKFAIERHKIATLGRAIITGLFALNAIALPFYASSRTSALLILIIAWTISRTLGGTRLTYRGIIGLGLGGLLLLGLMTLLRQSAQTGSATDVRLASVLYSALDGVVYNRNFGDMQVTSHIVNAVPNIIPFQHGDTITTWFFAPIPRSLWPEKPIVNVGPLIGTTLYGTTGSGVPPGFVADFYLNFGIIGALVGALALGLVLGRLETLRTGKYGPKLNPGAVIVYYAFTFYFANSAMQNGIGAGFFTGLENLVPAIAGLCVVGVFKSHDSGRTVLGHGARNGLLPRPESDACPSEQPFGSTKSGKRSHRPSDAGKE
jgi:oligosaccharide repeat unit polymerase